MPKMTIYEIGVNNVNYQPLVLLKEQAAERYLLIKIGRAEAEAIAIGLEEVDVARPLSHDLLLSLIGSLEASVDYVIINDLKEGTYYSKIVLNAAGGKTEIDSRPSDALALAIRARAPIFAEESVMNEAGLLIANEKGEITVQEAPEKKKVSEEEINGMSAFTDFISNLDIDDFDKGSEEE